MTNIVSWFANTFVEMNNPHHEVCRWMFVEVFVEVFVEEFVDEFVETCWNIRWRVCDNVVKVCDE